MKLTSQWAHEAIKPEKSNYYKTILLGLWKIKQGTSKEIAKAARLSDEQTRKRLSEMERKGWIKSSEMKRCETTGRMCQVWKLNYKQL